MSDIVERLRAITGQAGDHGDVQLCMAAADEITRLRSQPCPYVTGSVTHYCTLTQFTLTDAEREAVECGISHILDAEYYGGDEPLAVVALRGLLERMK